MALAPSLATLNEELEQLTTERAQIRAQHPGAVMPDEARARDAEIADRVGRVTVLIEQEQQRKRDALFNDTAKYIEDPNYRIPRAVNSDDAGRRVMAASGWDIRGGWVFRQTARGEVAFCPEAHLFGAIPTDDPVSSQHVKQLRAIFQPEYRDAFTKFLNVRGDRSRLTPSEQAALSEGSDTAGGYLVPADVQAEILARRADASVMRRLATVRQTSRDRIQFPAVAPNTGSAPDPSIYSSGFVGGLVGERPSNSDTGPTFQQFEIGIKKFEAYTKVTNDLISDSMADVLAFLSTDGGRNLGLVEDKYFLTGDGSPLQPMGILNSGLTTFDVEGTTADVISSTIAAVGSIPKIVSGSYLVPAQYAASASWLMSRVTQGQVHALVDANGRPWWQPQAAAGGAAGAPPDLLGFPVYNSPFVPNAAVNATKELIVGDFSAYIIADRTALSVQVVNELYAATDEVGIFLRSRAGGGLWNTDALRVGIV